MKNLLVALFLAVALSIGAFGAALASYTDAFGNTYTDAQVAAFCHALRPGSAAYVAHNCAALP